MQACVCTGSNGLAPFEFKPAAGNVCGCTEKVSQANGGREVSYLLYFGLRGLRDDNQSEKEMEFGDEDELEFDRDTEHD